MAVETAQFSGKFIRSERTCTGSINRDHICCVSGAFVMLFPSLARLRLIEYNTGCESERQCLSIEFTITCYSYAENREVNDAHPPF